MQIPFKIVGFLFFGVIWGMADPIQQTDISAKSPWAAHLDAEKLRTSPLGRFLEETAGFERVVQLENSLKEKLSLDPDAIEGVTLFGSGKEWKETALLIRGDLESVNLEAFLLVKGSLGQIHQGPEWHGKPLYFAKHSGKELVGGTSIQAVRDSLEVLDDPKGKSWQGVELTERAEGKLASSLAVLALDMKRIGTELDFEADLTRAAKNAWFTIGSHDEDVEVSVMIHSTDAEGLLFLQNQWAFFAAMMMSGQEYPAEVREMVGAVKIETHDHWMTATVSAPPEKIAKFLESLKPMFRDEPKEVKLPKKD